MYFCLSTNSIWQQNRYSRIFRCLCETVHDTEGRDDPLALVARELHNRVAMPRRPLGPHGAHDGPRRGRDRQGRTVHKRGPGAAAQKHCRQRSRATDHHVIDTPPRTAAYT